MGEICGDDRFELIDKAKRKLLDDTNIESRPEEIAVLDSVLFRCWQMGWLDRLRDADTRWHELFGTPERAARTLCDVVSCVEAANGCDACEFSSLCARTGDYDALLEWLGGDAE